MSTFPHCEWHNWIWDDHTNEYICVNCGYCVDCIPVNFICFPDQHQPASQQPPPTSPTNSKSGNDGISSNSSNSGNSWSNSSSSGSRCTNKKRPFSIINHAPIIRELCSKLHIEGDVQVDNIVSDFARLYNQLCHRKDFTNDDIAAISLYKSLATNKETRRPLKDICRISGSRMKTLWKIQKHIEQHLHLPHISVTPLKAEDVIKSKIGSQCGSVKLTFSDFKRLKNLLNKTRHLHGDFSIFTISATLTYTYLQCKNQNKVTKKDIAQLFSSTSNSISRFQSYLKKNNVTLTCGDSAVHTHPSSE